MRIFIRRGPKWLAATAALATVALASPAGAQYAPYNAAQPYQQPQPQYTQPQYGAAQSPYTVPQAGYAAARVQQPVAPQYAAQGAYQGYVQPQPVAAQQTAFTQPQGYGSPYGSVPYTAMAYQGGAAATTPVPAPADTLPLTPPAETVPPGASQQNGAYIPQPTPAPESYNGYGGAYNGYSGAYNGNGATGGYDAYGAAANTGNGAYGGAGCAPYGACDNYSTYGGMSGCLSKHAGCGYWFGGVYGLLMDRDDANKYPLVFTSADGAPDGYYPPSSSVVLRTRDVDIGFQPGVEFRLGRTFGCEPVNPCDPCGCSPCMPKWGLEGVYWTIFEDDDDQFYVDQANIRTYSMMPMAGLEYNPGSGYRPVNEYWDYGPPVRTQDIRITLARVHSSFEVQNVEVNLLRLGVCGCNGGPAYSAASGVGACGGSAGYGCDSGACADPCATGCNTCAPRGPRYSCTGVCGFRWMQFNEDFMYGVDFLNTTTSATGFLNYWSTVENNLFGAQIGCNGMYRIGCKWGFHLASAVGLYGNDIDVRQYMVSPTGQVRFVGTQENFDVRAYKTDVSMLGELRIGASYQATCRCRLYGGWRAIGVTGIALATDQAPTQFLDAAQLSRYVNSNGSMILHGLQAGVEWNY